MKALISVILNSALTESYGIRFYQKSLTAELTAFSPLPLAV